MRIWCNAIGSFYFHKRKTMKKNKFKRILLFLGTLTACLSFSFVSHAQGLTPAGDQPVSQPIVVIFLLFLLSLAPFILMMTTSFIKIAVVLSLVRQALGTQQIPPNPVITGLALILTLYVMIPVGQKVYQESYDVIHSGDSNQPLLSMASVDVLKKAMIAGKEPVREFLLAHANKTERKMFYNLAKKLTFGNDTKEEVTSEDFIVIVPAFVISELAEAFQIGFIIFLPFLIIDMVVSNVLLSMGMFQLSPITVSLPFKLLLFVLVDGWSRITEGLVTGYIIH